MSYRKRRTVPLLREKKLPLETEFHTKKPVRFSTDTFSELGFKSNPFSGVEEIIQKEKPDVGSLQESLIKIYKDTYLYTHRYRHKLDYYGDDWVNLHTVMTNIARELGMKLPEVDHDATMDGVGRQVPEEMRLEAQNVRQNEFYGSNAHELQARQLSDFYSKIKLYYENLPFQEQKKLAKYLKALNEAANLHGISLRWE